jgi:hypothetical protein
MKETIKMDIITDDILHLYISKPGLIEEGLLKVLEHRIKDSEEIKERLKKIKQFHDEYIRTTERESGILKSENENDMIIFYPQEFGRAEKSFVRLAADTVNDGTDNFKYVKTFACSRTFTLMRLHYNPVKKTYKLFLISERKDDISNVKVRIPELNMEFISDEDGVVDLKQYNISDVSFILIDKTNRGS